jgi:periplasmic copper chaperone A
VKRILFASLLLCGGACLPVLACPGLGASGARIPEAPPVASVLAGYAKLINNSDQPLHIDRVDGADFGSVEMHQMSMEGGMMQMRPLAALDLPAHGGVTLDGNGKHLMLMNPKHPFKAGDSTTLEFHCGKQSTPLRFTVEKNQP